MARVSVIDRKGLKFGRFKHKKFVELEFQRTHTLCALMSIYFQSTAHTRSNITALQLLMFCTAHACLASLSSLMEAEPEISSAAHAHVNSNEEV